MRTTTAVLLGILIAVAMFGCAAIYNSGGLDDMSEAEFDLMLSDINALTVTAAFFLNEQRPGLADEVADVLALNSAGTVTDLSGFVDLMPVEARYKPLIASGLQLIFNRLQAVGGLTIRDGFLSPRSETLLRAIASGLRS